MNELPRGALRRGLCLGVLLAGCGGGGGTPGSSNAGGGGGDSLTCSGSQLCVTYSVTHPGAQPPAMCSAGDVAVASCPTSGRLGCCEGQAQPVSATQNYASSTCYYSDGPDSGTCDPSYLQIVQMECSANQGTWAPN